MNAEWHRQNVMPKNATEAQRVAWHSEHAKFCACRPIPPTVKRLIDRAAAADGPALRPAQIRQLLSGGDRRDIAQSGRVRAAVERDPSLVAELASLTTDENWLVTQRAIDLLEKLAHDHPDWIEPHKRIFIGPLAQSDKWEIRLQIVRALPLFNWTAAELRRAEAILVENVSFPQTFVRAWALDGLATLSQRRAKLAPVVQRHLREFERSSSKALQARARQIRQRLTGDEKPKRPRATH
jgi:HEAT repeat protein